MLGTPRYASPWIAQGIGLAEGRMIKKNAATIAVMIAGIAAVAVPVFASIELAKRESLDAQKSIVLNYANDILYRSSRAADQIFQGIDQLVKVRADDPCSDANIQIMREIDLSSSMIQTIGHVADGRLVCSSLGRHEPGLPLGPVDVIARSGSAVRIKVELPFPKNSVYTVIERAGYAAIIHRDLPIDVSTTENGVSLATYTTDNRQIRSSRGLIKPAWLDALHGGKETTFFDGEYVVAVAESAQYSSGAIAAVPATYLEQRTRDLALVLVPIGAVSGIALALAVLYLARMQLSMPGVLRVAIRRKEFFLAYQPIVNLRTGEWVGAEALIRWRRPGGELVRPDLFIQAAEDSGLIQRITEQVFEIVARESRALFALHKSFYIGINLSAADLHSRKTIALLGNLLSAADASPHNIHLEATERGFVKTELARELVREIRAMGVGVSIDDFGTGYSSLSYLETFELDYLKIDKSFIDTIGTDAATSQVVVHIIEMAKSLNLKMIAEGVETEAQARFLVDRGVQYAQGWLFAKAMPISELIQHLPAAATARLS